MTTHQTTVQPKVKYKPPGWRCTCGEHDESHFWDDEDAAAMAADHVEQWAEEGQ